MIEAVKKLWNSFSPAPERSRRPIRNSYEAAGSGRRLRSWQPGTVGPNQAIIGSLDLLRSRSRDATRNNAWIKKGINSWTSNEIGTGIEPRSLAPNQTFRKKSKELWDEWIEVADADEMLNFYGMLSLASRTRVEAGEVFLRFRPRSPSEGLPVPLQLQILEPEMCPVGETRDFNNGRKVRAGIEFDGRGKRRAYHMYRNHPGDLFQGVDNTLLSPVPADSVIHHYAPLRAGQIRGLPWTIQSLIKAKDFDEYDDAELIRKKDKAAYTGVFTRPNWTEEDFAFDPITGEALERDANGVPMMNIESGSFAAALPGENVELFEGDNTGSGYADFVRQQLMGVAAGLDIPYEFLTGDMQKVNDRLMRVILNEFHRILMQSQWHLTIPQICRPVWIRFIDLAVLSGALSAPGYATRRAEYLKVDWRTDRWDYIHPLQDVQAEQLMVKSGFKSRQAVIAERGDNAEDVDQQNAEDKERAEKLGLSYDSTGVEPETEDGGPETEEEPARE